MGAAVPSGCVRGAAPLAEVGLAGGGASRG